MVAAIAVVAVVLLVAAASAFVLVVPSESEPEPVRYPEAFRTALLQGCTYSAATEAQCECVLREFEARIPFDRFTQIATGYSDRAARARAIAALPELRPIIAACR